jgi:undecaprenyl diphosphate synthase
LLWQSAYAEYHFTDILWPDFNDEALADALADYSGRKRRYGKEK